jgi:hypothetical protein
MQRSETKRKKAKEAIKAEGKRSPSMSAHRGSTSSTTSSSSSTTAAAAAAAARDYDASSSATSSAQHKRSSTSGSSSSGTAATAAAAAGADNDGAYKEGDNDYSAAGADGNESGDSDDDDIDPVAQQKVSTAYCDQCIQSHYNVMFAVLEFHMRVCSCRDRHSVAQDVCFAAVLHSTLYFTMYRHAVGTISQRNKQTACMQLADYCRREATVQSA